MNDSAVKVSIRKRVVHELKECRCLFLRLLHRPRLSESCDPSSARGRICSLRLRRSQGFDLRQVSEHRIRISSWRSVQETSSHLAHVAQVICLSRFAHRTDRSGGAARRLFAPSLVRRVLRRNWRWHTSSGDRDVDHPAADLDSFLCFSLACRRRRRTRAVSSFLRAAPKTRSRAG